MSASGLPVSDNPNDAYGAWILDVARSAAFRQGDRLGTANYIDADARRRAAAAVVSGECVALARPLRGAASLASVSDARSSVVVEVSHVELNLFGERTWTFSSDGRTADMGVDTTHVKAHGVDATHLDALNHIGRGGDCYSGFAIDDVDGHSVEPLSQHGLFTRGVLVDIPRVRGTDWVDADLPVTAADIDAALAKTSTVFEPGDALLLYMGRDRYEASGRQIATAPGQVAPGCGMSAARWIVEHQVSILCWDFLDATVPAEPDWAIHLLIWAVGLILIDNADLGGAAEQAHRIGRATGAFTVSPAPVPRATSALVQPLFVQ